LTPVGAAPVNNRTSQLNATPVAPAKRCGACSRNEEMTGHPGTLAAPRRVPGPLNSRKDALRMSMMTRA
jgi:hypothetical protein